MSTKVLRYVLGLKKEFLSRSLSGTRFTSFSTKPALPILTLYTKHICPLCDEAKAVLESYKHRVASNGLEELEEAATDDYGCIFLRGSVWLRGSFFIRDNIIDMTSKLDEKKVQLFLRALCNMCVEN